MTYVLKNERPQAKDRLAGLGAMLDLDTIEYFDQVGLTSGWSCWDVGGGDGTIARRMWDTVGPTGHVTVTDVDLRYVEVPPPVRVVQHDVAAEPPPGSFFDLVHARLVLAHLPQRVTALRAMVSTLRPGGVLIVQDWGAIGQSVLLYPPDMLKIDLFDRFQFALGEVFTAAGNDRQWCTRTYATMVDAGLERVTTQVKCHSWHGGTAAARVNLAVSEELFPQLLSGGRLTEGEIHAVQAMLTDPGTVFSGHATWTTIGHRPVGGAA